MIPASRFLFPTSCSKNISNAILIQREELYSNGTIARGCGALFMDKQSGRGDTYFDQNALCSDEPCWFLARKRTYGLNEGRRWRLLGFPRPEWQTRLTRRACRLDCIAPQDRHARRVSLPQPPLAGSREW